VQNYVKFDDNNNVIGSFVKKGPCMVKSTVISMRKSQCESLGSFLEVEEKADDEEMTASDDEEKDEYWPGAHNKPKTPAAVPNNVKCCVKLDENNNVIGGFVKKGPCMVKSTVISMLKSQCEGLGSLLEVEEKQMMRI